MIFFTGNLRVSLTNKTFTETMNMVWNFDPFKRYQPLKMVFAGTGKVLFMDKQLCTAFLTGEISQEEVIKLTQCDELYRNKTDLKTEDGFVIDAGHLWKANHQTLTLVDDDNHVTALLDTTLFEVAE